MEEKTSTRPHRLMMQNRSALSITGIRDVVSFDETLEKGEVDVDGSVDSLIYSSNEAYHKSGESLFSRLFR